MKEFLEIQAGMNKEKGRKLGGGDHCSDEFKKRSLLNLATTASKEQSDTPQNTEVDFEKNPDEWLGIPPELPKSTVSKSQIFGDPIKPVHTMKEIAKLADVAPMQVYKVEKILKEADP